MKIKDCEWCYEPFIGKGVYCFACKSLNAINTTGGFRTGICTYCGEQGTITKDHVLPKSKGGKTTIPSCYRCNSLKENFALTVFLYNVRFGVDRCKSLSREERSKIVLGIRKVISMNIEN